LSSNFLTKQASEAKAEKSAFSTGRFLVSKSTMHVDHEHIGEARSKKTWDSRKGKTTVQRKTESAALDAQNEDVELHVAHVPGCGMNQKSRSTSISFDFVDND